MKIKNKLTRLKWWFQRANGKVTPDEWWDFKYNLVDYIKQGLEGLLDQNSRNWNDKIYNEIHKQTREDLEYILDWAKDFPYYESAIVAIDLDDWVILKKRFQNTDVMVITQAQFEEFEERTKNAMELLAKNIHWLWD